MNVSNTMDSPGAVSRSAFIYDGHALPHGILNVRVDTLWEAVDHVHDHSPLLVPPLSLLCMVRVSRSLAQMISFC